MSKYRELTESSKRTFAVGDIHACPYELEVMLKHLMGPLKLSQDDQVVFIGDYIDRGPNSKAVIDSLLEFQKEFPKTIFLRGNHEDMLLGYLGYEGRGAAYLVNGGDAFFESYSIKNYRDPMKARDSLPPTHLSFFLNLEGYIITDDYVFVHGGLNPLRDLRSQLDEDLYWIRDPFIENIHHFEKIVIFGHTPYQDLLLHLPYKIGIDTGLVYGNMLTTIELTNKEVFQVTAGSKRVKVGSFAKK